MRTLTEGEQLQIHERVRQALAEARRSRYPVVLVLGRGAEVDVDLWRYIAEANGLALVDMMQQAQDADFQRRTGVWPTVVDWIREQALAHGGVVVADLDAVATGWDEEGRRRFFWKLLKSETRNRETGEAVPIVAPSQLALQCELPTDTRNYGVVLDLMD